MKDKDKLFSKIDIFTVLQKQEQKLYEEIDNVDGNELLNIPVDDLCDYFDRKYQIEIPVLTENDISIGHDEVNIDVRNDFRRAILDKSQPVYVTGTKITFYVPFKGEKEAFYISPSPYGMSFPHAILGDAEIELSYSFAEHGDINLEKQFQSDLANIKDYLKRLSDKVKTFNSELRVKSKEKIMSRRKKLLKDKNLVEGLGFPLRRRDNAPQTYIVPTVQRKPTVQFPSGNKGLYKPEPELDMKEYEHILSVIYNMVAVIERSPKAFAEMKEEHLRMHFLVQLNGQYEGQATGETFNFEGKTDILIRVKGENIFIAECKFWDGQKSLNDALDQLLGYLAWRDTKTALLIFNRKRNFTAVLDKIPEVIKSHPYYKRELHYDCETGFRFVLHHKDDVSRDMILTILAFEVPV